LIGSRIGNGKAFLVYNDHGVESKGPLDELGIKVFIGIKTDLGRVHGARLPQITKTWLQDVETTPEIDLKFFGRIDTEAASMIGLNVSHWVVPVVEDSPRCRGGKNFCCKDESMFKFFLENYAPSSANPFSPWFCSFDDDNYVLVENLLQVLTSYYHQNATKLYVGRPSVPEGMKWTNPDGKAQETIHFLTGGAGYCITRELMEYGRDLFSDLTRFCTHLSDDMAIGYIVNSKLGVKQQVDEHFHSHLERIRSSLPRHDIAKQVSFGYDNKMNREQAIQHFPNIPIMYDAEEDPMLFRSLRSFLQKDDQV
jgi:hypothetical protein